MALAAHEVMRVIGPITKKKNKLKNYKEKIF